MTATMPPRIDSEATGPGMLRAISYGGGVQSTALVVLAATGRIEADVALFSNVGDDSERKKTLRYVREVAIPWATERGFPIEEIWRTKRDGTPETLYGQLTKPGTRTVNIPVRMANGAPGNRNCTHTFKRKVVEKWLKEHGASATNPATVLIGFSTDEIERVNVGRAEPHEVPAYPLLDLGLSRSACEHIISDVGLPIPPKSACYFCPYKTAGQWAEQRRDEPEEFWKSVALERHINGVRHEIGKDDVYLTRFGRPLDQAIGEAQPTLWSSVEGPEMCDSGACWT